jgi:hypothetical protein
VLPYLRTLLLAGLLAAAPLQAAEPGDSPATRPSGPIPTEVMVRVVAHGAMVLGDDVGGARVTITEVETGRLLASGLQQGETGDQNQIMRTPRFMGEPRYSGRPAGSFRATIELDRPTLVEISAAGPLAYPAATQRASQTVLLIPGQDLSNDGIVLHLNGYIVQIEHPAPGEPLIAKEDVRLRASVRTLSGAPLRPYGDWDSRRTDIFAEVMIGDVVVERLQMFYVGQSSLFEAPFFVPRPSEAPNGFTLRVVAADRSSGNFGMGQARYPVLPEQLRLKRSQK